MLALEEGQHAIERSPDRDGNLERNIDSTCVVVRAPHLALAARA
jgi:hypothetical protein